MNARLAAPDALEAHNSGRALYRDLFATLWSRRDPAAAVDTWESYQAELARRDLPRREALTSATLLGWILRADGVYSWLADNRRFEQAKLRVDPAALRAAIRRLARSTANRQTPIAQAERDAAFLRQALIDPWRAHLDPTRVLLLEADAELAAIPWTFLLGPDQPATMLDGLGHWSPQPDPPFSRRVSALVLSAPSLNPDLLPLFPPLEAAREEGAAVHALFDRAQLFEGRQATLANLAAHSAAAEIFHFAGHGFANAGNGALMLAPGDPLDAPRLRSMAWSNCRLAVLSACTTGVGEHQGPVNPESLARALLDSGVRRVLASRWAVDSATTRLLIQSFYRELLAGAAPAHALTRAVRELSRLPGHAHPYYWAGFQLYGQP